MRILILSLCFALLAAPLQAQDLLEDQNGDEEVTVDGFGDSISFGAGDGTSPGQFVDEAPVTDGRKGYLLRVRTVTGIRTNNLGNPGELFTGEGIERLPGAITPGSDIVALLDGSNDARFGVSGKEYRLALQRAINVITALGKEPVLFTLLPPCCNREGGAPFTSGFSSTVREIAIINDTPLADIERAWNSTCPDLDSCDLYNRPEGLHPNTPGHDAISQVFLATLGGIDIFTPEGQEELAKSLDIPIESIVVTPDTVTE